MNHSVAGGPARLRGIAAAAHAVEATVAVLLAATLLLPIVVGGKVWQVALVATLGVGLGAAIVRRALPRAAVVAVYLAVYAVAALHGGAGGASDSARYFLRPLAAVAIALLVRNADQRRRVLALVVLFIAVEIPVTAGQVIANVVRYGRGSDADSVTGTLGSSQAGTVTLVAVFAAVLVVGAWLARLVSTRRAAAVAVAFAAVGVFSATRAILGFVPVFALGVVGVGLTFGRTRPPARYLAGLLVAAALAVPAAYGAIRAIYPAAFVGALSSQTADVLGGAAAQGIPPPAPPPPPPGAKHPAKPAPAPPPVPSGVELLPGRVEQLKLAVRLSIHSGVATGLVGRGLGASMLDPRYHLAQDVPLAQRTGPTWIGRVLTETGWLGLAAFGALLAWLALLGRRLWLESPAPADRALGAALPGIAALTAAGALFTTILDVRGYSAVFWVVVGVAISAAAELRRRADATA